MQPLDAQPAQEGDADFRADQLVFREPTIRDFYDTVADALLATLQTKKPLKVRVRSKREGQLVRVRLNSIANQRLNLSWWHWCATRYTLSDPDHVYVWIGEHATPADFMAKYFNFPADRVMKMMQNPKISTVKLPAQRRRAAHLELE